MAPVTEQERSASWATTLDLTPDRGLKGNFSTHPGQRLRFAHRYSGQNDTCTRVFRTSADLGVIAGKPPTHTPLG